jgi:methyl-accepting chemotaxis protein
LKPKGVLVLKSFDETAEIIKVINEITFQAYLLQALNVAVEAARAAEAGKGFAAAAETVFNLAMCSIGSPWNNAWL